MSEAWSDQPRRAPRAWSYRIRGAWAVLCGRKVPVSLRTANVAAMAASEAIETLRQR